MNFSRIMLSLVLTIFIYQANAQPTVLISYHSKTGNTEALARAIANGAQQVQGVKVIMKTVEETTSDDLLNAGAVIVGSPVYNAGIAPAVSQFISSWPFEGTPMKDKLGAAFVTAGGISAGEELAMLNILHSMMIFGMIVMGGDDWTAPFGASAISDEAFTGNHYHDEFMKKGENLGKRVAGVLVKLQQ
jgi:NAD(P)H dehydrogenase (quinone)